MLMSAPIQSTLNSRAALAPRAGWIVLGLAAALALSAHAAQSGASFAVSVNLLERAATGLCRSDTGAGAYGATVTVVCATGTVTGIEAVGRGMPWVPTHGGAYRYLTRVSSDDLSGTVDSYTGSGTSTAFRIVSVAGREYVEMTVGW